MTAAPVRHRWRAAAALLAAVALSACGEAAGKAPAEDSAAPETIEVVGVDYAFEGVPATVPVGTELTFRNDSDVEAHEMVVFRIADDEERPITELLALPQEEGAESPLTFLGGAAAVPGAESVGLGGSPAATTLTEPGRYALVCHLPVGADPDAIAEALQGADGPPDLGDAPPHFTEGMVTELTVG
jgi:plastocyanin